MLPLLPPLTVMPLALTVTLLPTFLLTKAKVPPLSESPPYSVPPVTMAVPAALVVASYTLFTLLVLTRRTKRFHGQILATYAMLYAMLRAFTETFRGDEERGRIFGAIASIPRTAWYNISTSQFVSLCMFLAGAALFARQARQSMGTGDSDGAAQPA